MSYIFTAVFSFAIGFVAGMLFFRNNVKKIQNTEDSGKYLLDALKGKNK